MATKKNVIVVGGGGAGAQIARTLSQKLDSTKHNLILISSRDFYLHLPGALRMLATEEGALEKTVLIPYEKMFHNNNGTFKQATVVSISRNPDGNGGKVITEGGEESYDVLVLAPGNHWEGGIDLPPRQVDAVATIQEWRNKFKNAKGIALVGGGAVGIEIAGEIRDVYADKKITLVHNKKHLLNETYPDKFRIDMENRMTQRQILLILDDAISDIPGPGVQQVVTEKGVRIDADLVVPARGGRPNTAFIASLGEGVLNSAGLVKVDPTLQLTKIPGVFAAGDVLDWKEVKQVAKVGGQVTTVTTNVLSYLNGQPLAAKYKSMFEAIFITNGANGGGGYMDILWGLCFGNWVTRLLKSRDLFISHTRKSLGYA